MKEDAQKDPTVFPEALHAKLLINQVGCDLSRIQLLTFMLHRTWYYLDVFVVDPSMEVKSVIDSY